jgi:hypothetical protein
MASRRLHEASSAGELCTVPALPPALAEATYGRQSPLTG